MCFPWLLLTGSGISSFKDNPEQAGLVISTCIDTIAIKSVPKHDRSQTPIYVGATAGMRLLWYDILYLFVLLNIFCQLLSLK